MDNQIFREKNVDRITSVEEMHDYMRVTSPKLWMVLIVILVLTVGGIIYVSTVTMENKLAVSGEVDHFNYEEETLQTVVLSVPTSKKSIIDEGMPVRIGGKTGKIIVIYTFEGQCLADVELDDPEAVLSQGTYDAEIILESVSPLSFLLN